MTATNNQPAPEGFLRLSSKWLETNPLPEDALVTFADDPENIWTESAFAGVQLTRATGRRCYITARTDLPREAYADSDEIRPMTHEERKALDEFTMKELAESEPAPDLTQPALPKVGLTQPGAEVASTSEEFINGVESVLLIRCTDCLLVPQQNRNEHGGGECGGCIAKERDTLRAQLEAAKEQISDALDRNFALSADVETLQDQVGNLNRELEAKEAECREFRGIVHQLDRRDALAGFKTVGDKISALLKIAAAADPKAELAKSIMENDKLRAEVEMLTGDRDRWKECHDKMVTLNTRLTADLDAVRKELFPDGLNYRPDLALAIRTRNALTAKCVAELQAVQVRCGDLERVGSSLLEWFDRDGSVGGIQDPIEDLRSLLTPSQQPDKEPAPPIAPEGKATEGEG